jgi:DNA-binding CsgD family transcriptional regulator
MPELLDRRVEREELDRLLGGVRAGRSRALVIAGEPGVGKTTLLEYVRERASGCRVVWAAGVQAESELAFAALHQLCAPLLVRLERLPGPQRDALGTAFGLRAGAAPDRFLIGLGALSLLSEVAEGSRPLVCLVDDAQWLDRASAQALAFVARRLGAESVALIFAAREFGGELAGLPELVVEGLDEGDSRALLGAALPGPLDERVRDRIVGETRGNPLALLELPRGFTAAELAGGFGLWLGGVPLSSRIEESFRRRLAGLPEVAGLLLLVAAAEPTGDPVLVWQAAERLGIGIEAATPATAAGLVEIGGRVRFSHPLVRSAVYQAASVRDRRRVHLALAESTDPDVDPDRRAWHRAQATPGLDEDVAAELERSADRARARGGLAAAAAFLARAAELTPEPARRAELALAAAQAKHQAGAPDVALSLLATAEVGPLDELQHARADVLRAQIAFAVNRGGDVPGLLLQAARRLEPLDVALARQTYLEAFSAALFAGRLARGVGLQEVARAARAAPPPAQPGRAADLLLDGLALLITEGYPSGAPALRRALSAFRVEDLPRQEGILLPWLVGFVSMVLWDDESWHGLAALQLTLAREAGALTALPLALRARVGAHLFVGEVTQAWSALEELEALADATGSHLVGYGAVVLAAWQGRAAEVPDLIETSINDVLARGEGLGLAGIQWANSVLHNGLGRYEEAFAVAQRASQQPQELLFSTWTLPELIEAASRSGQRREAAAALRRLSEATRASGSEWARGVEARSRALLSEGEAAEDLYREAIDRLAGTRLRVELARAHLLYGEWLRRESRRMDARRQLRRAHEMFSLMGAEAFADRAGRELAATGETVRRTTAEALDLTPQETRIARLARDGASNQEIATQLFISRKTVEYHLRKVFTKLGISRRSQLHRVLPAGRAQPTVG